MCRPWCPRRLVYVSSIAATNHLVHSRNAAGWDLQGRQARGALASCQRKMKLRRLVLIPTFYDDDARFSMFVMPESHRITVRLCTALNVVNTPCASNAPRPQRPIPCRQSTPTSHAGRAQSDATPRRNHARPERRARSRVRCTEASRPIIIRLTD